MKTILLALVAILQAGFAIAAPATMKKPNILWLSSEDHGPHMGCYGDSYATTPNVDRLASRGLVYTHAWSCAPVCAPARTTIISGMYAPSTGAEHMRSMVPFPAGKSMFPKYLRDAGYYCSNNAKEDYNLEKGKDVWNESSRNAHWKKRDADQPFFAVFNSEKSHESQIRTRPHKQVHDPKLVRVPAYHPDTPEVRKDWAQYYDQVTAADADAGKRLQELQEAGLEEDTIVIYFSDHGSGMPRNKRWPYNSGLQVSLVVYIPEKFKELRPPEYRAGGKSDRLVSFVDFAPTMLSLAGIRPPEWMQGHAFLGKYTSARQPFVYGFRGRMDERYDFVRSITDGRYVYVRNYLPHLIYGQHLIYMWETPTTVVWERLHKEGKLNAAQDAFWNRKPPEELYDLQSDPDEVNNLANSPDHRSVKARLQKAQQTLARKIRDTGFLPEGERLVRGNMGSPYDMARDGKKYPLDRVMSIAEKASNLRSGENTDLVKAMKDPDPAVRYWGLLGLYMRGGEIVRTYSALFRDGLEDSSHFVRIVAGRALAEFGATEEVPGILDQLVGLADWGKNDVFTVVAALTALDELGDRSKPVADKIKTLPELGEVPAQRFTEYPGRLLKGLKARF